MAWKFASFRFEEDQQNVSISFCLESMLASRWPFNIKNDSDFTFSDSAYLSTSKTYRKCKIINSLKTDLRDTIIDLSIQFPFDKQKKTSNSSLVYKTLAVTDNDYRSYHFKANTIRSILPLVLQAQTWVWIENSIWDDIYFSSYNLLFSAQSASQEEWPFWMYEIKLYTADFRWLKKCWQSQNEEHSCSICLIWVSSWLV